jgi:hypothetical protein
MADQPLAQRRMITQRLWGKPFATLEAVVRWMGAMQAQEFLPAKWSIAQRAHAVDNAQMDRALADGRILRTHILRPTWHFAHRCDIRWLIEVSAPRVKALMAYYDRQLALDAKVLGKSNAVIARSVQGGKHLTRNELASKLGSAGILAHGQRLGHLLMHAELDAVVCSGALRGKQQTYALLEERAAPGTHLDPDAALAELSRRYFQARGPATVKDYMRWASLSTKQAKLGLEMVKSELEHAVVDGRTYWFGPRTGSRRPIRVAPPVIDLVQGYDEIIMSYSESKDVLWGPAIPGAGPPRRVAYTHAVLRDGRLLGHWRHELTTGSVTIETLLFRSLTRAEIPAMRAAVTRYGRFVGRPASWRNLPAGK